MTDKIKDSEPAFPIFPDTGGGHAAAFRGMTLRDYFAAQMLASVFASTSRLEPKLKDIAAACYRAADAMMEARAAHPMCKKHPRYSTYPLCPDCQLEEEAQRMEAPAARGPLTQTQVVDAFCKLPHNTQYVSVFDAGVRFAEAHHGIGKEKK